MHPALLSIMVGAQPGKLSTGSSCPPHSPGRATSAALMAWLYALYSFDYKWAAHGIPLITRVSFFETHWAYFAGAQVSGWHVSLTSDALHSNQVGPWQSCTPLPPPLGAGFGLLPILPVLLTSFFIGSAVVGVAFPLFIILAADANPKARQAEGELVHCIFASGSGGRSSSWQQFECPRPAMPVVSQVCHLRTPFPCPLPSIMPQSSKHMARRSSAHYVCLPPPAG